MPLSLSKYLPSIIALQQDLANAYQKLGPLVDGVTTDGTYTGDLNATMTAFTSVQADIDTLLTYINQNP